MSLSNSKSTSSRIVELIADDLTYCPSPEQRKAKSAFWRRFNENPMCDPRDITQSIVAQFLPSTEAKLSKWWSVEGFKEWFRNQEEFRERAEYLANLAMDAMESILVNEDPRMAGPRSSMIKLAMEIASKMPSKGAGEPKYIDAKIAEMDRKQLEEFISRQLKLIPDTK